MRLTGLLLALVAFTAQAQIVPGSIKGVRNTNQQAGQTFTPVCLGIGDPNTEVTAYDLALVDDVAFTFDLADFCGMPLDTPPGILSYATQSGTFPTGIAHDAGVVDGTPTTAEVDVAVIRITYTPIGSGTVTTLDVTLTMTVESPTDETAPAPPANLVVTALSTTSLEFSADACADASGIQNYDFSSAGNQSSCTNADNNVVTVASPLTTRTGLDVNADYWAKGRCRDDSPAHNTSAWSACVQGFTNSEEEEPPPDPDPPPGGGGGQTALPLLMNYGFENYTAGQNADQMGLPNSQFGYNDDGELNGTTIIGETSTLHAREGTKSFRSKLVKTGTTVFRSELAPRSAADNIATDGSGLECFGFSIYIPTTASASGSIKAQSHTHDPHSGNSPQWGILTTTTGGDGWVFHHEFYGQSERIANLTKGVWNDFVMLILNRRTATGSFQIFLNGTEVYNRTGVQTAWSGENLIPEKKMGQYSSGWKSGGNPDPQGTVHETFHDAFRQKVSTGGVTCTYDDVAPQGDRLAAP